MSTDEHDLNLSKVNKDIELLESLAEELDELEEIAEDLSRQFHNIVNILYDKLENPTDALAWSVAVISNAILSVLYRNRFRNDDIPAEVIRYLYLLLFDERVYTEFMQNLRKYANILSGLEKYR